MDMLQARIEVQGAVQQWVDSFMQQYQISPAMMDDALSKVLVNIKELVLQEFITAAQNASSAQVNIEEDYNGQNNEDPTE